MLPPEQNQWRRSVGVQSQNEPQNPPPRLGRPVSLDEGFRELTRTVLVVLVVILTTRYLLRVHL